MTFRFTTAGESHGRGLVGILEGIPAGLPVSAERINAELKRRMGGYGRGARMKIESDQIEWLAGVRAGETLGSPIAMLVWNRDWEHWQDVMAAEADAPGAERRRQVTRPRPGHADLAGSLKYDRRDARDILERASARETVARVACGAVCKILLEQFGVEVGSHVVELGGVRAGVGAQHAAPLPARLNQASDASPVRCLDPAAEKEMIARIDAAKAAGDTLGGVVEVIALGLPAGLGSHVSWDAKLDGRLAQAGPGPCSRNAAATTGVRPGGPSRGRSLRCARAGPRRPPSPLPGTGGGGRGVRTRSAWRRRGRGVRREAARRADRLARIGQE